MITNIIVKNIVPHEILVLEKEIIKEKFEELNIIRNESASIKLHSDFLERCLDKAYPSIRNYFAKYEFIKSSGFLVRLYFGSKFCNYDGRFSIEDIKMEGFALYRDIMHYFGNEREVREVEAKSNEEVYQNGVIIHRNHNEIYVGSEIILPLITEKSELTRPLKEYYDFTKGFMKA